MAMFTICKLLLRKSSGVWSESLDTSKRGSGADIEIIQAANNFLLLSSVLCVGLRWRDLRTNKYF